MTTIIEQVKQQISDNKNIELVVDNFICKDWKVYYNLFNPENFQDPDNAPDWYDASSVYTYNENPLSSEKVQIISSEKVQNFQTLLDLIENAEDVEHKLLTAILHYTFGDGGAYAEAKYYNYSKRTMELLHKIDFTNEEFIKRNLCLHTIEFGREVDELILHFNCSWDDEHGLLVTLKNNEISAFNEDF